MFGTLGYKHSDDENWNKFDEILESLQKKSSFYQKLPKIAMFF